MKLFECRKPVTNLIFSLVLFTAGLVASSYGLYQLSLLIRLNLFFRETKATVVDSSVIEIEQFAEGDSGVRIRAFRPLIVYQYEVDSAKFTNDRYRPIDEGGTKEWAESIAKNHPKGSEIVIYCHTSDPAYSVIEREVPRATYEKIIFACAGGFFCLILSFYFFRNRHSHIVNHD